MRGIILGMLVAILLPSCAPTPNQNHHIESFISDNNLSWTTIEQFYELSTNIDSSNDVIQRAFAFVEPQKINKVGLATIDKVLDAAYQEASTLVVDDKQRALFKEFTRTLTETNLDLKDLEGIYFSKRIPNYYYLAGNRYHPTADPYVQNKFKDRLSNKKLSSIEALLDSLKYNRLPEQARFKNIKVDLEIKTDGFERFNVPYLTGYELPFHNHYYHDSIILIPDTLTFYSDVIFSQGKTHYEITFKVNGKSHTIRKSIPKRDYRLYEKIPLELFVADSIYHTK